MLISSVNKKECLTMYFVELEGTKKVTTNLAKAYEAVLITDEIGRNEGMSL